MFCLRAMNFEVSNFDTSKFETCLEEMQPVALEKNDSNTKKHHTYTQLLAIKVYQIFKETLKTRKMIHLVEKKC